jgi:hypothetical protein
LSFADLWSAAIEKNGEVLEASDPGGPARDDEGDEPAHGVHRTAS